MSRPPQVSRRMLGPAVIDSAGRLPNGSGGCQAAWPFALGVSVVSVMLDASLVIADRQPVVGLVKGVAK